MKNIYINEPLKLRAVVSRSHIEKTVYVGYYTVASVVAEDNEAVTRVRYLFNTV